VYVFALTKAGVGTNVIAVMIRNSGSTFGLDIPAVIALADSGVAGTVMYAVLQWDDLSRNGARTGVVHYHSPA
jgi:hypothetical protein